MLKSIRWRITIPFVALFLVTMAMLGIYLSMFFRQVYVNNLETQLAAEARLVGDTLASSSSAWQDPARLDVLAHRWAEILGTRVTIIAPDGRVIGESDEDRTRMENHLNRPEIAQALLKGEGTSTRFSDTLQTSMLYSAVTVRDGGREDGRIVAIVRIAIPLAQVEASVNKLQQTLIGTSLLALLVMFLLAAIIARQTTQPLRALTQAATQLSDGKLKGPLTPATPDEVGQLTQAFNTMAGQLHAQLDALETERSKLAAVLRAMTDGVLIIDEAGKVQLINPAASSIFGISIESALGRTVAEVVRQHQFVELWRRCRETDALQSVTTEYGPRRQYLQGVATPLNGTLPNYTLFVFQNLTRVRQLETVRRDFISNISHELRTPLASLKALTETLQEGALEDPPAARRFLQRIEAEVDALTQMVAELLELSRIESGRVPLQMEPTPPEEILQAAVERLRLQAERAGLAILVSCPPDLPEVQADSFRLEQVVMNLLHNAIKFTNPGGRIDLSATQKGTIIEFYVADTGVGIPVGDLPRIFERFYKTDRARSGGGTGLGLAIARHLVEAHGGRIWAESSEGQGSVFYFSIPIARK